MHAFALTALISILTQGELATQAAVSAAPLGSQTPCEWVLELRDAGVALPQQAAAAGLQRALFTRRDIRCLKRAGVHRSVLQAIQGGAAAVRMEKARAEADRREAEDRASRVDIELLAVRVGPGRADQSAWDGFGTVSTAELRGAALLAGSSLAMPAAEAGAWLTNTLTTASEPPDVYGYAEFIGPDMPAEWSGVYVSLLPPDAPSKDTFYATFPGSPGFTGVRIGPDDSVRITLYDRDLSDDDDIGCFDVSFSQLVAARDVGDLALVPVAKQTSGQVLAIVVRVRGASSTSPSIRGSAFRRAP